MLGRYLIYGGSWSVSQWHSQPLIVFETDSRNTDKLLGYFSFNRFNEKSLWTDWLQTDEKTLHWLSHLLVKWMQRKRSKTIIVKRWWVLICLDKSKIQFVHQSVALVRGDGSFFSVVVLLFCLIYIWVNCYIKGSLNLCYSSWSVRHRNALSWMLRSWFTGCRLLV